ncbi:MAG TPA: flagellar assembly peptidoglycan hydrolase FlgJ [Noviherbaspirillum sp.]|uniref:flagellar assembly peptidoglycan hydrolase FlgJ n=1 Tax=Noviherbaspirillum sp. TaxID=1926288 RepID=UPI002B46A636|nr:flagellar assembly peptidoglycan hydrolase FlgJ [Noviherbaspirillum sp.]HJV88488.1 flagellar assembly peptidoglycan hydrolase FlgJ [Noviherbaspirillum sp.]
MINPTGLTGKLAIDVKDMNELRQAAKANSPEALKTAATQFEALFMNMMLKSMREATPQDGMFDNEQTRMYTGMLDQQLSQTMASRGIGLADALFRQLSGKVGNMSASGADGSTPSAAGAVSGTMRTPSSQPANIKEFRERLEPHAEEASRATGIPAKFMLGQAALESGWGRREIINADGSSSHNLFGIKATGGWKGKVVEATTTEYVNGEPQTKVEKFRAYDSYADAFRDYANLLRSNPRYQGVLASGQDVEGFAQGLQRAGYATDPNYAAKLTRIITHSLST